MPIQQDLGVHYPTPFINFAGPVGPSNLQFYDYAQNQIPPRLHRVSHGLPAQQIGSPASAQTAHLQADGSKMNQANNGSQKNPR